MARLTRSDAGQVLLCNLQVVAMGKGMAGFTGHRNVSLMAENRIHHLARLEWRFFYHRQAEGPGCRIKLMAVFTGVLSQEVLRPRYTELHPCVCILGRWSGVLFRNSGLWCLVESFRMAPDVIL